MKRLTCCWHCLRPGDNLRREAGNAAHGAALQSEPSSSSELKMQRGRVKYTGAKQWRKVCGLTGQSVVWRITSAELHDILSSSVYSFVVEVQIQDQKQINEAANMSKTILVIALLCIAISSPAAANSGGNFLQAADIRQAATEVSEDEQLVIDITSGLLQISTKVLQNLSRFVPASRIPTIRRVNQHLSQLMAELDTQPDAVLSATQDERLESLLNEFGPSDPFSSLPFLSVDELKPGDIILRRSSALASQMTELMIWSPYTHSALYIGDGMIIDSTWEYGVKTRSLADLLDESIHVGVLRMEGLTSDQADMVVLAAQSKESSEYNFENVKLLGVQKLDVLTNVSRQSLGEMIGVLGRAEYLPPDATDNGKYACSELIVLAFKAANITLSHANGFTPGDMVRLGQAGFVSEVGRLQVPAQQ